MGARTAAQLQDYVGALTVTLGGEHLGRLEEASRIDMGFPHDFLPGVRDIVYAGTYDLIDNHRRA